jgi:predicted RNA binding protein with dsRBD fold (UPF0201 family)
MKRLIFFFIAFYVPTSSVWAARASLSFTVTPSDATITINGQYAGTGSATFELESAGGKVLVTIEKEGYTTYTNYYCYNYKYGGYNTVVARYNKGDNHYNITLRADDTYVQPTSNSTPSDSINKYYSCKVNQKYSATEAWKAVENIVLDYFEDVNFSKMEQGNLKTPWIASISGSSKIRTRLIARIETEQPLTYKFNLQSEYCTDRNAYEYDDYRFQPWNSVMNKYNGVIKGLILKLK